MISNNDGNKQKLKKIKILLVMFILFAFGAIFQASFFPEYGLENHLSKHEASRHMLVRVSTYNIEMSRPANERFIVDSDDTDVLLYIAKSMPSLKDEVQSIQDFTPPIVIAIYKKALSLLEGKRDESDKVRVDAAKKAISEL